MIQLLINPFHKYSEKQFVIAGILFTIVGSALGIFFNARFDGLLDLHFATIVGFEPFTDNLIAIGSGVIVLFSLGKFINSKTRFIDILNVNMIARIPIYLLTLFNANDLMNNATKKLLQSVSPQDIDAISGADLTVITLFSIATLGGIVWYFLLLWNGFKVASNAQGIRHIALFILAVVIGEVITKLVFIQL